MIVLTVEQTAQLIFKDQYPEARLRPVRLTDGRYAVNENVLNDPRHARWHHILRQGTIADASTLTFGTDTGEDTFQLTVDGKLATVGWASGASPARAFPYPQRGTFDMPAPGLYRFEAQYNNDHLSYDWQNNRRRCELGFPNDISAANGETWWSSWATILTDRREGLLGNAGQPGPPNGTLIHQWFNGTSGKSGPFLWLAFDSNPTPGGAGCLYVSTRNSGDVAVAGQTNHYAQPFAPATGTPTYFVVQGTFGQTGHLNVWMNGTQIVNADCPLGFYSYPSGDQHAHIATGIYQANVTEPAVLYHANVEWGPQDLSARITTPLSVPTPTGGWV